MARRGRNPNLFIRLRIKDSIENRTREGGTQAPFIMGTRGAHSIRRWYNNPPFFNSFTVDEDTGVIGSTFQFDISASDFDGDVLSYSWSISGPGSPSLSLSNANKRAIFTAAERGDYTITVSVSDGIQTISQTKTVSVLNRAPTQNTFTIDKTSGYVGDSFVLTMVSNTDPDGDPVTITWSGISSDQISVENPSSISSVATVTPTSAGTFTITATLADDQDENNTNTYSKEITVAVNSAPTLRVDLNRFTGNVSNTFTAYAITSDPEGDSLTYRWFLNGVEQTGETGDSFSVRPGARGSYTVRAVVSDGYNEVEDEDSFEIVNRVPSLSAISISPVTTGNQDTVFTASVTGIDPDSADSDDVITYSWSIDSPGGSLLDPATLTGSGDTVTFNPPDGTYGEYIIYVSGSDQYGGTSSTQEATITVANRLPEISTLTVTPETGSYGNNRSDDFTFEVTGPSPDLDGHPVTVSWSFGDNSIEESYTNLSDGVLTSRAIISGSTLVAAGAGTYSMQVTLDDGQVDHDGTTTQDISFELLEKPVPPVSLTLNQSSGFNDDTFAITASHDDYADIAGLTYTWSLDGVEQEETGSVLSVESPSRGTHTVVVTVRDEGGYNEVGESTTFEVLNRAPVINSYNTTPITGNLDTTFTHSVSATDADGDGITYTWNIIGASGANITGSGAQTTFKAPEIGTYYIDVTASDDYSPSLSTNQRLDIEVENRPPTISSFTVNNGTTATGTVNDSYIFEVTASDPDNHSLTYTWGSNAGSSVFSLSKGDTKAIYNPGLYRGSHAVSVRVRDGYGGDVTETINILIQNQAPIAQISRNPSQPLETGQAISLYGTGSSDPDGDSITSYAWSIISSASSGYTLDPTTGDTTTFTPTDAGTYVVGLTVGDGMTTSSLESIELTITSPGGGGGSSSGGGVSYPSASIDFETFGAPFPQKFIGTGSLQSAGVPFGSGSGVSYSWSLAAPAGSTAFLVDPYLGETDIQYTTGESPPVAGSFTVSLTVSADLDGDGSQETGSTSYTYTVTSF